MAKANLFISNFSFMKKFIFKVFSFAIILLLVISALNLSVPFYWGNDVMTKKMEYLLNNTSNDYNTFFVGSSHTYRHINPLIFDSITNCKSFNLGAPAMGHLEANFILENFLNHYNHDDTFNVFLKNTKLWQIKDKNLHSVRTKYYLDFKRTVWAVKYWFNKSPKNFKQVHSHVISYLENILCIGKIKEILFFHFYPDNSELDVMIDQNGFYSLDQELKLGDNKELLVRKNKFQRKKNKGKAEKNSENIKIRKMDSSNLNNLPTNENYYRLGKFRLTEDYFFDRGHFNNKGASLYSTKIGESFIKLDKVCN